MPHIDQDKSCPLATDQVAAEGSTGKNGNPNPDRVARTFLLRPANRVPMNSDPSLTGHFFALDANPAPDSLDRVSRYHHIAGRQTHNAFMQPPDGVPRDGHLFCPDEQNAS